MTLQNFSTPALLDMLALQTEKLLQMFKENPRNDQYEECKNIILQLQSELESRKKSPDNVSATIKDVSFKTGETTL